MQIRNSEKHIPQKVVRNKSFQIITNLNYRLSDFIGQFNFELKLCTLNSKLFRKNCSGIVQSDEFRV